MRRYKGNTGIQSDCDSKYILQKKKDLTWSLGMTECDFLIFAGSTTHIKGEQYPPENFFIDITLKKKLPA